MPCDTIGREERERLAREVQLKALIARLNAGTARIERRGNTVTIEGWQERGGWCDACAVRALRQSTDYRVRLLISRTIPSETGITFGHGH